MQTANISNQNFGASLSSKVKIKHLQNGQWRNKSVSFVKFDTYKTKDRTAIKEVSELWGGDNFSASIAEEADILGKASHVYGITLQDKNFGNIDSQKVLGLLTTDKIDKTTEAVEVYRIGVIPEFSHSYKNRKVKHIGTALVEGLRKTLNKNSENPNPKINVSLTDIDCQKAEPFFNKVL